MRNLFKKKDNKNFSIKIKTTDDFVEVKINPEETNVLQVIDLLQQAITFVVEAEEEKGNYVKIKKEVSYIS